MAGGKEDACPESERTEAVEMAVGGSSVVGGEPAASALKDLGVLEAAPAVDPPLAEAAAVAADSSEIKWVEMPLSNVRWVLARTRETDPVPKLEDYRIYTQEDLDNKDADMLIRRTIATLQAGQDDIFEYQAWLRDVILKNGRVMVPEDFFSPTDELNKTLKEIWDGIDADPEATDDSSTNNKEVLPSKI